MKVERVRGDTAPCTPDPNIVTCIMSLMKVMQLYVKTAVTETHSVIEAKYNCDKHFLLTEQVTNGS